MWDVEEFLVDGADPGVLECDGSVEEDVWFEAGDTRPDAGWE